MKRGGQFGKDGHKRTKARNRMDRYSEVKEKMIEVVVLIPALVFRAVELY